MKKIFILLMLALLIINSVQALDISRVVIQPDHPIEGFSSLTCLALDSNGNPVDISSSEYTYAWKINNGLWSHVNEQVIDSSFLRTSDEWQCAVGYWIGANFIPVWFSNTVTVEQDIPATAVINAPSDAQLFESITITCAGSGNEPLTIEIDPGDGVYRQGSTLIWSYSNTGEYTARCRVIDADGDTATDSAIINVHQNLAPIADFSYSPIQPSVNELIVFNASNSYDADGEITDYYWDFGDGITTTGRIVTHSYAMEGDYTVTLTVVDNDGATSSVHKTIHVVNPYQNEAPTITFNGQQVMSGQEFEPVKLYITDDQPIDTLTLKSKTSNPNIYVDRFEYHCSLWDKIIGIFSKETTCGWYAFISYNPGFIGSANITIRVVDNYGLYDEHSEVFTVTNNNQCHWVVRNETINLNEGTSKTLNINDLVYTIPESVITIMNGQVENNSIVQLMYTPTTLTLTGINDGYSRMYLHLHSNECGDRSYIFIIHVIGGKAFAVINGPDTVKAGEEAEFNAYGSYGWDGSMDSIETYEWFIDGNHFITTNPFITHTFRYAGVYNVTLVITDNHGNKATASKQVVVLSNESDHSMDNSLIGFMHISVDKQYPEKNSDVRVTISIVNSNDYKLRNLRVKVVIPGIGVNGAYIGDLSSMDQKSVDINMHIPYNAKTGIYPVIVEVTNGKWVRKDRSRWIFIKG